MSILTKDGLPLTQSDGKVLSDIPNGENNFYYHRYKDGGNTSAYFSSEFLKDIVINSNNQVERLFSANTSNGYAPLDPTPFISFLYQDVDVKKPVITKEGLNFTSADVTECKATGDVPYLLPLDDYALGYVPTDTEYTVMFWHKPTGDKTDQYFFAMNEVGSFFWILYNFSSVDNKYTYYINGVLFTTSLVYPLGEFNHIAVIRSGVTNYFFINGILLNSSVAGAVGELPRLQLGTLNDDSRYSSDCILNDIYINFSPSVIDPTGYSVGHKVFEPPVRGGFESEIKQYPIP